MRVKANGINISCTVEGPERAPCIVFSNSLCTTGAMWDEQAAALKSKYRVVRYDQRGHGGADAPSRHHSCGALLPQTDWLLDPPTHRRPPLSRPSTSSAIPPALTH